MKLRWWLLLGTAVILVQVVIWAGNKAKKYEEDFAGGVDKQLNEDKKKLPEKVANGIVFIDAHREGNFIYYILQVDRTIVEIDADSIEANRPNMVKAICEEHHLGKTLKTSGYSLIYRYVDQYKKNISELAITGKDCNT